MPYIVELPEKRLAQIEKRAVSCAPGWKVIVSGPGPSRASWSRVAVQPVAEGAMAAFEARVAALNSQIEAVTAEQRP